jgi:type II secretory pathway component PulF
MPSRYRYQATDAEGKPVSGELEAASRDEALTRLASEGLVVEPGDLEEVLEAEPVDAELLNTTGGRGGRLSSEEAIELAGHVADLAKAQLPLAPGLRAMADELPGARVSHVLRRLAAQLESGASLEDALLAQEGRLPAHVTGMIVAGVRSGRLAEVMEQFVAIERGRQETRHRIAATMFYPTLLFIGLLVLLLFFSVLLIPQFRKIFEEFDMELPSMTEFVLWFGGAGIWYFVHVVVLFAVALYLACTLPRPYWLRRIAYVIPLIGPILRASSLVAFSRLMKILLDQRVPLSESLRMVAEGVRDPALAGACRAAARDVEAGSLLSEALAGYWQFPPTLQPLVQWGQGTSNLAEAFYAAGEMYEGRLRVRDTLLATVIPPLALLIIGFGIGFVVVSLFMPLINLISALS